MGKAAGKTVQFGLGKELRKNRSGSQEIPAPPSPGMILDPAHGSPVKPGIDAAPGAAPGGNPGGNPGIGTAPTLISFKYGICMNPGAAPGGNSGGNPGMETRTDLDLPRHLGISWSLSRAESRDWYGTHLDLTKSRESGGSREPLRVGIPGSGQGLTRISPNTAEAAPDGNPGLGAESRYRDKDLSGSLKSGTRAAPGAAPGGNPGIGADSRGPARTHLGLPRPLGIAWNPSRAESRDRDGTLLNTGSRSRWERRWDQRRDSPGRCCRTRAGRR